MSYQVGSSLTSFVEQSALTQEVSSPHFLFRYQENLLTLLHCCIFPSVQFYFTISSLFSIAILIYILKPGPEHLSFLIPGKLGTQERCSTSYYGGFFCDKPRSPISMFIQ